MTVFFVTRTERGLTCDCYHSDPECNHLNLNGGSPTSFTESERGYHDLDPCPFCTDNDEWGEGEMENRFPPEVLENIESVREKFEKEEVI